MEQQEEKNRKVYRRRKRTQSKSTSSLPLDVTSEISKLPAKSVVRFCCVSKQWSSITKEPYFINSFETQSSTRPKLLFCFKNGDKLSVFSIPQPRNSNESYTSQPIDRYHMKFPEISYFSVTESVHGLICFQQSGNPIVWNPSMRQFLTLSKPTKSWTDLTILLGYDPIEGKHKVVCLHRKKACDEYRILTLGSAQESWRSIKPNIKHLYRSYPHTYGRCINGVLYYRAYFNDLPGLGIMSFDVRSEKFNMIQLPSDIVTDVLTTYEGRLACHKRYPMKNGITITLWILEDAEKQEWSSKHFPAPFNIYYFDPERNTLRKIEFKEITDDEFWLSNRLRDGCIYTLHTFAKNIERLMSL